MLQKLNNFDDDYFYISTLELFKTRTRPNIAYFDFLQRKKPITDLEIDGKRVLLKCHLKLAKIDNVN